MSCNTKSRIVINTIEEVTNVVLQLYIPNIVDIIKVVVEKSTLGVERERCVLCLAIVRYLLRILLHLDSGITMLWSRYSVVGMITVLIM